MEYLGSHSFGVYLAGFCRSACEVHPASCKLALYTCAFLLKFQSSLKIRDLDYAVFKPSISSVACYCTIPLGLHVHWDVVLHSALREQEMQS